MSENAPILMKNVRVSFPHFWEKPVINGDEGKHGATFLLDPKAHAKLIKKIEKQVAGLCKERNKGKKLAAGKICLRDGDDSDRPEYAGLMTVSANTKSTRPIVMNAKAQMVTDPEKDLIYGGCYVNAKINLWFQNNTFGKRVNATLLAVQFAADGEPFDGSYVSPEDAVEGFEAVEEADEVDSDDLDDEDFDDETPF